MSTLQVHALAKANHKARRTNILVQLFFLFNDALNYILFFYIFRSGLWSFIFLLYINATLAILCGSSEKVTGLGYVQNYQGIWIRYKHGQ
jgi:hypothetical protein